MGKQYCSVCTRPKLGHPRPFGKKCKMPPLSEELRQKYLAEQQQLAKDLHQVDTEDELTEEEDDGEIVENQYQESLEAQEEEEKRLQAMKLEMLAQREKVKEQLGKMQKAKEVKDRMQKLREEMQELDGFMQKEIAETKGIYDEISKPFQPLTLPGLNMSTLSQQTGENTTAQQQQQPQRGTSAIERGPVGPTEVTGQQPPGAIFQGPVGPGAISRGSVSLAEQQQQPGVQQQRPGAQPLLETAQQPSLVCNVPGVAAAPGMTLPTVHGGARPKTAVAAAPPPGQLYQALDPGLTAYGQACASDRPTTAATAPGVPGVHQAPVVRQPGPTLPGYQPAYPYNPAQFPVSAPQLGAPALQPGTAAQAWIQSQPLLAAAAGLGAAASPAAVPAAAPRPAKKDRKESAADEGKCLPELFIEKSAINDCDVKVPSYYDFMHGVFRMLDEKLNENGENINEYIVYYEQITSFATQHRWPAVFSLHRSMCSEVERGMRSWSSEIKYRQTSKHLNTASDLSEVKQKKQANEKSAYGGGNGAGDRKGGKNHSQNPRPRMQSDRTGFHSHSNKSDAPICSLFNHNMVGCSYGANRCDYRHECQWCEERGVRAQHPAMYCQAITGSSKPSDGSSKQK